MDDKKDCCRMKSQPRSEEEKRALEIRLNRVIGQLNGVRKMIVEDRYCGDILIQLSSVEKVVRGISATILETHMKTCMVEEIKNGNEGIIDEIFDLIGRMN